MQLSVVIPSYNGQALLQDSLPPLLEALQPIKESEIIVVDNGSTDSTSHFMTKHYPDVHLIELDKNYGFTRAANEGIRKSKSEYVLILNNDCFVKIDTVSKLLLFIRTNVDLVATQPIVARPTGEIENIGYVVDLKKGKATVVTDKNLIPSFDNQTIWDIGFVYGLSGACLLVRRDILKKMEGLDESFHSYLEDVDLFIRFAKKKYQWAPCLDAIVTHQHMSTSAAMKGYKEWHDLTNWIRIIIKNYPTSFIIRCAVTLCIERLRNLSGWLKRMNKVYPS
ncbi:N/A [soil metagenome]